MPTQLVHPSPSRRMRDAVPPLQPFASNLSTVRQREGDTPSSARPTALGMHGNFTLGSCCVVAPIATVSASCRRALDFTNATPVLQCSSATTGSLTGPLTGDSSSDDEEYSLAFDKAAPTIYSSSSGLIPTDDSSLSSEFADFVEPSVIPVAAASPLSIREETRSVFAPVRSAAVCSAAADQDDNSRAQSLTSSVPSAPPPTSSIYQAQAGLKDTDDKPTKLLVPAPREVTCAHVDAISPEGSPVSISSTDEAHSSFAPTVFSPGYSKPLASNARNGRKHKYSLRSRVNTG